MRPYLFLHTVAIVVFSSFVFGSYIPRWKVTEVFEDISDYDTHIGQDLQPKYTVFLDEDELGRPKPHHDTEKRGYYTCFNRQVHSPLTLQSYLMANFVAADTVTDKLHQCRRLPGGDRSNQGHEPGVQRPQWALPELVAGYLHVSALCQGRRC